MKRTRFIFLLLLVPAFFAPSCKKEKLLTDAGARLEFSRDTILFDTVFTTVGSVTKFFQVRNTYNQPLKISKIALAGGQSSFFRLNVDGVPGKYFEDIEIPAKDSIFIFVEVTVDPTLQNNPLIIADSILFELNGNVQDVDLVAWGQDAYFHGSTGGGTVLACNLVLQNDKPHVFYGYSFVDSACCLTIPPGTRLYFHPNSALVIYKGCLNATGSLNNKIIFQGDRLEYAYSEIPGQWDGIRFIEAQSSYMEHCLIKNGFYGIWCDSTFDGTSKLDLIKTEIRNEASLGIYVNSGARISGVNCLVSNCGQYTLACTYGGDMTFKHCTFANFWSENPRSTPSILLNNWYEYNSTNIVRPMNAVFDYCIMYGDKDKEFQTDFQTGASLNYVFTQCFFHTDEDLSDGTHYVNCSNNVDPLFTDVSNHNYHPFSTSPCVNAISIFTGVFDDMDDYPRDATPDIGCYEVH